MEQGLIDARNALYVDPITGKSIPISQAIEMGLVDVNTVDTTPNGDDEVDVAQSEVGALDRDLAILSVTDPRTGREISLTRAIQVCASFLSFF